ncbi:type I-F CRISPR-associated protein Csy3 [Vibrio algicola]|uniref:Type I-F CRISPR-associated protein Csy3 n=1 Tax=Vibrio algicola TaxID=2662262 RepID=A0A5Q0TGI6_9VIBR|nr:type I-F CRISPR-associated protein Csy3 [Vibrio algicola]
MKLCKQLNYVRSLSSGKACFFFLDNDQKMQPISIDRTRLRGSKGDYSQAYSGDLKRKNVAPHELAQGNIHFIEECYVPPTVNEIYCAFSLRIKANSLKPEVCSDEEVRVTLTHLAMLYAENGGYEELAQRYAKNILLGTWLWRNRESRGVRIEVLNSEQTSFVIENALKLSWHGSWDKKSTTVLNKLTHYLTQALTSSQDYFYMDIKATISVGWGDEVFPSQEFLDQKENGKPTKRLSTVCLPDELETVAFHAQKVGAAIQCIDDWWQDDADKPLRVNEYGADREYVIARRHSSLNTDFYYLISQAEHWIDVLNQSKTIPDEVHFIMSVLVKGGLFNSSKDSQ